MLSATATCVCALNCKRRARYRLNAGLNSVPARRLASCGTCTPPQHAAGNQSATHLQREAIALAIETVADLVVLDDQHGRRLARERAVSITGTVGLLIEARGRGMIPSVRRELDCLIEAGMWIDEVLYGFSRNSTNNSAFPIINQQSKVHSQ